ncbi:recombinase family protein [Bradyrhizobium pachyrhizi]|uniref:recombinase family protein n=1 Tax=Bradyrhizobium pachyrhizi TaxID=280333 RepID=UPI0031FC61C0
MFPGRSPIRCGDSQLKRAPRPPAGHRAHRARGASLRGYTEQHIDTSTAAGKCFLDMLGVFAEFETNLRSERQLESVAEAKARGVYQGRTASIDTAIVKALKAEGMGASAIAKALRIGRVGLPGS